MQKACEVIREHVECLEVDGLLSNNHNKMKALVKSGEILDEDEKVVGKLGWDEKRPSQLVLFRKICYLPSLTKSVF